MRDAVRKSRRKRRVIRQTRGKGKTKNVLESVKKEDKK